MALRLAAAAVAVLALAGCSGNQIQAVAPSPAAATGRNACELLDEQQIRTALGSAPTSTDALSKDGDVSCQYIGEGDAYLTIRAHRVGDDAVAKAELATERKACPTAVDLAVEGGSGFTCPATETGGTATTWAEWQTIVLNIQLRPSGERNPASTGQRIQDTTAQVQENLTFDLF